MANVAERNVKEFYNTLTGKDSAPDINYTIFDQEKDMALESKGHNSSKIEVISGNEAVEIKVSNEPVLIPDDVAKRLKEKHTNNKDKAKNTDVGNSRY